MAQPKTVRRQRDGLFDLLDWEGVFTGAGKVPQIWADFLQRASTIINIVPAAIDATATATVAQLLSRYITSTSAAAVALTLPSAAAILAAISQAGTAPAVFEFYVDNSAGANTITVTLPASITNPTGAITGGNALTVTTTEKIGCFRLVFYSTTAAYIYRIL